jgi:hypothetical protein
MATNQGGAKLREQLKDEAITNADRDLAIAADWFPLEKDAIKLPKARPVKEGQLRQELAHNRAARPAASPLCASSPKGRVGLALAERPAD